MAGAVYEAPVRLRQGPSCCTLLAPATPDDVARPTTVGTAKGAHEALGHPRRWPDNAEPPGPGMPDDASGAMATTEARVACTALGWLRRMPVSNAADRQVECPIMPLLGALKRAPGGGWPATTPATPAGTPHPKTAPQGGNPQWGAEHSWPAPA